ncbi:hypothetical protein C8Q77DRAFT_332966 [Trametes polyzona]|nr:hypothetical protein C8Q77DRAFT_332966 [Trametes polyzona]
MNARRSMLSVHSHSRASAFGDDPSRAGHSQEEDTPLALATHSSDIMFLHPPSPKLLYILRASHTSAPRTLPPLPILFPFHLVHPFLSRSLAVVLDTPHHHSRFPPHPSSVYEVHPRNAWPRPFPSRSPIQCPVSNVHAVSVSLVLSYRVECNAHTPCAFSGPSPVRRTYAPPRPCLALPCSVTDWSGTRYGACAFACGVAIVEMGTTCPHHPAPVLLALCCSYSHVALLPVALVTCAWTDGVGTVKFAPWYCTTTPHCPCTRSLV